MDLLLIQHPYPEVPLPKPDTFAILLELRQLHSTHTEPNLFKARLGKELVYSAAHLATMV
jgi:hypothetical protein